MKVASWMTSVLSSTFNYVLLTRKGCLCNGSNTTPKKNTPPMDTKIPMLPSKVLWIPDFRLQGYMPGKGMYVCCVAYGRHFGNCFET